MATTVVQDEGQGLAMAPRGARDEDLVARLDQNIENQKSAAAQDDSRANSRRPGGDVVYAPELGEVANDKDALATLRGQGRYFGVTDPDVDLPVCSNCQRRGHIRSQCKVVVCHACGKVDDHYESQCPNSMVCSNCGEKGHFRNNCTHKRKHLFCQECESHNHTSDRCPTIWRDYIVRPVGKDTKVPYPSATIFCYNCADKGHYGDECRLPRTSKTPNLNGSAFSGENLPKTLVGQYFTNFKNSAGHSTKRRYEDAFSNYNYMPPPHYNKGRNVPQGHKSSGGPPGGPSRTGFLPLRPQSQSQSQRYAGAGGNANTNANQSRNRNSFKRRY